MKFLLLGVVSLARLRTSNRTLILNLTIKIISKRRISLVLYTSPDHQFLYTYLPKHSWLDEYNINKWVQCSIHFRDLYKSWYRMLGCTSTVKSN